MGCSNLIVEASIPYPQLQSFPNPWFDLPCFAVCSSSLLDSHLILRSMSESDRRWYWFQSRLAGLSGGTRSGGAWNWPVGRPWRSPQTPQPTTQGTPAQTRRIEPRVTPPAPESGSIERTQRTRIACSINSGPGAIGALHGAYHLFQTLGPHMGFVFGA